MRVIAMLILLILLGVTKNSKGWFIKIVRTGSILAIIFILIDMILAYNYWVDAMQEIINSDY